MEFSTQSIAVSLEQNLLKFCPTKVPSDPNVPAYKQPKLFTPTLGAWKSHMQHGMASHPCDREKHSYLRSQKV
jgi:hypothetical protein